MFSEDDAIARLRPLAQPIMDAYANADEIMERMRDAGGADFAAWRSPKRALHTGVGQWAGFASNLEDAFAGIPNVTPVPGQHTFRSIWMVGAHLRLHLESDVHAFDVSQMSLADLGRDRGSTLKPYDVVLTWSTARDGEPRFVRSEAKATVWSRSVRSLIAATAPDESVRPERPKSKLQSRKTKASDETRAGEA